MATIKERLAQWWAHEERTKRGRQLGLGIGMATAALSLIAMFRGQEDRMTHLAITSAVMLALGLVLPDLLYPVAWAMEGAVKLFARTMTYVTLFITFYVVFAPAGIVLRLLGKDPLHTRLEPEAETYWIERRPGDPKRVEKQF